MEELILEQFENEISTINKLLLKAQEAFLIVEYLCQDEEIPEAARQKNMNAFFAYSRVIYWQIMVIEVTKLFYYNKRDRENTDDKRERFNLLFFLKKLRVGQEFGSLNIESEKINDWEKRLEKESLIILNLLDQRDKIYAHEDEKSEDVVNKVSLKQAKELIKIAKDIIYEINSSCFKRAMQFDLINSPVINLKFVIDRLTQIDIERTNQLNSLVKDK